MVVQFDLGPSAQTSLEMPKSLMPISTFNLAWLFLLVFCMVLPAVAKPDNLAIARQNRRQGEALFRANGCFDCHSINGRGCTSGIDLSNVGLSRTRKFLEEQLVDPEEHVKNNKKAFGSEPNMMTNPNLSKQEIALIVTYLQSLRKSTKPAAPSSTSAVPADVRLDHGASRQ